MIASAATAVVVRTTEAADRHPHSHKNGNRLCSASRIWKAVQDIIARGNLNDWNEFARVDADAAARIKDSLLQSTFHNNRARFAPSQKHKVLQFSNKALLPQAHCKLGKSIKNLNCIQIAMLQDHEPLACALFLFIRDRATAEELGAFMNDCWSNRNTTLHMACFLGMADLVRLYVEAGAALSPKNGRGLTPAECTSREDILALLLAPPPAQDTSSTLVGTLLEDFDVLVPLTKLHVKYTPDAPKLDAHHMKVPDIIADSESTTDESEASFGSLPDTGVACDPFDLTNSWLMYHRSPSPVKVRGVPVNDLMNTWYMRACLADMTSIGGSRPTAMARAAVDLTNTWFMGLLRSVQSPQKIHGAPTPVDLGTSWFASVVDDAIVAAGIISQTMIDACDSQLDHLGVCLLFPDRSGSSGQPPSRIDDDDNGASARQQVSSLSLARASSDPVRLGNLPTPTLLCGQPPEGERRPDRRSETTTATHTTPWLSAIGRDNRGAHAATSLSVLQDASETAFPVSSHATAVGTHPPGCSASDCLTDTVPVTPGMSHDVSFGPPGASDMRRFPCLNAWTTTTTMPPLAAAPAAYLVGSKTSPDIGFCATPMPSDDICFAEDDRTHHAIHTNDDDTRRFQDMGAGVDALAWHGRSRSSIAPTRPRPYQARARPQASGSSDSGDCLSRAAQRSTALPKRRRLGCEDGTAWVCVDRPELQRPGAAVMDTSGAIISNHAATYSEDDAAAASAAARVVVDCAGGISWCANDNTDAAAAKGPCLALQRASSLPQTDMIILNAARRRRRRRPDQPIGHKNTVASISFTDPIQDSSSSSRRTVAKAIPLATGIRCPCLSPSEQRRLIHTIASLGLHPPRDPCWMGAIRCLSEKPNMVWPTAVV